jgi:hypothetical protein
MEAARRWHGPDGHNRGSHAPGTLHILRALPELKHEQHRAPGTTPGAFFCPLRRHPQHSADHGATALFSRMQPIGVWHE